MPAADQVEQMRLARDNLADHVAAIAANLQGAGGRFLEQAVYSDELTAASARQFNRETLETWQKLFDQVMPRLQALTLTCRHSCLRSQARCVATTTCASSASKA